MLNFKTVYRIEKIARSIFEIVLIIVVLVLLYANISQHVFGHVVIAVVRGNSMQPLLKDGDIVVLVPAVQIRLGDIVVFRNDRNELVVHRVIAIIHCGNGEELYITKGDNDAIPDPRDIARITSKTCNILKKDVLAGYEEYVRFINRGIPHSRIVGKVLSLGAIPLKISGFMMFTHR